MPEGMKATPRDSKFVEEGPKHALHYLLRSEEVAPAIEKEPVRTGW
jgi:hypothetical protein